MTGAAAARAVPAAAGSGGEFPGVLDGVVLEVPAARLAGMLDSAFLAGAGWDPVTRVLSLPAGHRLLGRTLCRVGGCAATAHGTKTGGLCWQCFARLTRAGRSGRRVRGSRVPADVPGRTAGAEDRPVPGPFAPVPPGRGDDDGTVPGRSAGAAAARAGTL